MTAPQIKMVRGLMSRAGLTEYKEELVLSFTEGRTEHLTDMLYDETQAIVKYLKDVLNLPDSPAEKMKRKVLSLAHEMKWHKPGTRKVDVPRVNKWCIEKSGFKKPLDDLNYSELPKVVTMFNSVYTGYLKGI